MATNGTPTNGATVPVLTAAQLRQLAGPRLSSPFTVDDRLYRSFDDFSKVYEYGDLDLNAMRGMLAADGNPRKLEQTLTLPLRGANWELRGGGPALSLVQQCLGDKIDSLIATSTSAIAYRKAFHEICWTLSGGDVIVDQILSVPAVSCEAAFRDTDGHPDGFRQQLSPMSQFAVRTANMGWVDVPANRSFIYVHGTHREPLRGVSDLDVALYCWDNIRKLQFLWCQFLEQQALPKVLIYGDDPGQAQANAAIVAQADASATIPLERRTDPAQKSFEILESSGKGADQFQKALAYWEGKQTQSVLASFMDLAQSAVTDGRGSNALSADQSEFFLASRQAVADEIAEQITTKLIRPLVAYNFGPGVEVPTLHIGPIGNRQTDRALGLLTAIIGAPTVNAPPEFTGFLLNHTASFLGLDTGEVADAVKKWGDQQQEQMQAQAQQFGTLPGGGKPAVKPPSPQDVLNPTAQDPADVAAAAQMSRAVDLAAELVARVRGGLDPKDALASLQAA